ncbi:hypothetical protein [Caballeronia sp. Lep1P3]|uniref:hypothetical protein n=1 Tax=Caballeronia sp. Lep1P3 TaxID=2878150 RepID=UPI001FD23C40|nr:hypothetical protein [Caballeronia sp. Lep1P3]
MAILDTLKLARALAASGVPRENAEAFALAFNAALEDSAHHGLPLQRMTTDELVDLTIKKWKECGCPLQPRT